jgi:hypothetical protein
MLRAVFVTLIIVAGTFFAIQGAFFGLLFYLWNAYFRPEDWTYGPTILSLRLSLIIGVYVVIRTIASFPNPKLNLRTGLIVLFFIQAVIGVFTSEHSAMSASFLDDFGKVLIITYLIVVLVEGKNRELRRLFSAVGHEPTRIHRISFGEYELGDLQPGEWREVDARQV